MMRFSVLTPRNLLPASTADASQEQSAPWRGAASGDAAERLRDARKTVRERAETGAVLCGWGTALAGAVLGAGFAAWRGLIPDLATTLAVGLLGILLFALAGGFLGALAGGTIGGLAGALEAGRTFMTGRSRA